MSSSLGCSHHSPTHHFQPYIYTSWTRIVAALLEQLGSRRTGQDVEVRTLALSTRLSSIFLQPPTHSPPQNPNTPNLVQYLLRRDDTLKRLYERNQDAEHAVLRRGSGIVWTPQLERALLQAAQDHQKRHKGIMGPE